MSGSCVRERQGIRERGAGASAAAGIALCDAILLATREHGSIFGRLHPYGRTLTIDNQDWCASG